jgi:hypothetical protein
LLQDSGISSTTNWITKKLHSFLFSFSPILFSFLYPLLSSHFTSLLLYSISTLLFSLIIL